MAGSISRRLHPLTILFSTFAIAKEFVFPAAVGIFTTRQRGGGVMLWIGATVALGSVLGAIARYLSFRYALSDDTLVIDSGVLAKKHRVIPLESIQNIDIRESAAQRLLGVAELRIETATGGREPDARFAVLRLEAAHELRAGLLARRAAAGASASAGVGAESETRDTAVSAETELAKLSLADLVIAGATANRAGVVLVTLAGVFQFVDDLAYTTWFEGLLERFPDTLAGGIVIVAVMLFSFLLIGWLLSIAGSILKYHGFRLSSADSQLRKSHGLLNRENTTLPLSRVQALRVEESVLRRPLALAAVRAEAAGSVAVPGAEGGAVTVVPITSADRVASLVRAIFADLAYADVSILRVHPRSKVRAFTRYVLLLSLAAATAILWRYELAIAFAAMLPLAWLVALWQYRHRGYAMIPGYVVARNGAMNRITWLVPDRKVQTLHLKESPFQRRHGLASVVLDTAGSGRRAVVHDVNLAVAGKLLDHVRRRMPA